MGQASPALSQPGPHGVDPRGAESPRAGRDGPPGVPRTGDVVADRYELKRRLGAGATGVVFEAVHSVIGKRVALKWLFPHLASNRLTARRFLNEARAASLVDHPNVIEIFDAGQDGYSLYLAMEILKGEPLSAKIARGFRDPSELVRILLPAMDGVAAAHEAGVIHRDLKPDNLFLCASGRGRQGLTKVLDFGVSKLTNVEGRAEWELTRAGAFVGSPFYTAPEQITHCNEVDGRADIYALGVILYEALTGGRLPHEAPTLAELFQKIRHAKPTPILELRPDLSQELAAAVHQAMSARAEDRFATMDEFMSALEPHAKSTGSSTVPAGDEAGPTIPDLDDRATLPIGDPRDKPRNRRDSTVPVPRLAPGAVRGSSTSAAPPSRKHDKDATSKSSKRESHKIEPTQPAPRKSSTTDRWWFVENWYGSRLTWQWWVLLIGLAIIAILLGVTAGLLFTMP